MWHKQQNNYLNTNSNSFLERSPTGNQAERGLQTQGVTKLAEQNIAKDSRHQTITNFWHECYLAAEFKYKSF